MKDVNQNFVKSVGVIPVVCLLWLKKGGTVCVGICCCHMGLSCGGVDWGKPSTVSVAGSALEGGLSPAKGPVVDCEEVGLG